MMEEEFPNIKFSIAMVDKELDEKVCEENEIHIYYPYNCYCYEYSMKEPDIFVVKDTKPITFRRVIEELCYQGFNPGCNHIFLEDIYKKDKNVYGLWMGS